MTIDKSNQVVTGYPPGMLQDDDRKLSKALANTPHDRLNAADAVIAMLTLERDIARSKFDGRADEMDALRADAARWRYLMSENDVDGYITGAGGAYWERGASSRAQVEAAIDLLAAEPAPVPEAGG